MKLDSNQVILRDKFDRVAKKLRISVTDKCNMKCIYCMPQYNLKWFEDKEILSFQEIVRITSIFADLGIDKLRITGGEPLLRPRLENLITDLKKISKIKSIGMTTNGMLLEEKIDDLCSAGITSLNISLDTFSEERFKTLNGIANLKKVIKAIQKGRDLGLKIKINTVVVRNWNDDEIIKFAKFAREYDLLVRFIEFMPLDGTGIWNYDLVVSKREIIKIIRSNFMDIFPLKDSDSSCSDPETVYNFADSRGKIGFIPSITEPFCSNCDRVRLTSDGKFLTCLFDQNGYDLKSLIRSGKSDKDIMEYICICQKKKPEGIIDLIRINALKPTLNLMHTIGG